MAVKITSKRNDYITWDEYFMGVAQLSALRSKDPNTQVGSCIVSNTHKILSMGYNGFPTGCSDDDFPWAREGGTLDTKYAFVTHSELNAILNYRGGSLEGSTLYVSLFPCNECAKAIIQCGIKTVGECLMRPESDTISIRGPEEEWKWICNLIPGNEKSCRIVRQLFIGFTGI